MHCITIAEESTNTNTLLLLHRRAKIHIHCITIVAQSTNTNTLHYCRAEHKYKYTVLQLQRRVRIQILYYNCTAEHKYKYKNTLYYKYAVLQSAIPPSVRQFTMMSPFAGLPGLFFILFYYTFLLYFYYTFTGCFF